MLQGEITTYFEASPVRFVVGAHPNGQEIRAVVDREPDPEWSNDLGHIALDARSALDFLIGQLAVDNGGTVPKPGDGRQFPIFRKRDDYIKYRGRMLKDVSSANTRTIAAMQPYQRGRRAKDDPLALLDSMTNREKHRDSHVIPAAIDILRFRLTFGDGTNHTAEIRNHRPLPIRHNEPLIGAGLASGPPGQTVNIEVDSADFTVIFEADDRQISPADIDRVLLTCSNIIERFAGRIKP